MRVDFEKFLNSIISRLSSNVDFSSFIKQYHPGTYDEITDNSKNDFWTNEENWDRIYYEVDDFLYWYATPVKIMIGLGPEEPPFEIKIICYDGWYWIEAADFEDIGYFSTEEGALNEAFNEYDVFIENYHNKYSDDLLKGAGQT